jgi:MFS superfamily sulfate permease-like transporter
MGSAHSLLEKVTFNTSYKFLVIRFREVHDIDLSGLEALEELIKTAEDKGIKVYLTSVNERLLAPMKRFGILDTVEGKFSSTSSFLDSKLDFA